MTSRSRHRAIPLGLVTATHLLLASVVAHGQLVTNWIAYNDHRPGPAIPPHTPTQNNWGTALRVTGYDMGAPADTIGAALTNFLDGQPLAATMTVTRTGAPDNFATAVPPLTNTPAHRAFFGKADLSNLGIVGVDGGVTNSTSADAIIDYVTFRFNNLDPSKRYYQWYKQGSGEIPNAQASTYSVSHADLSDSGNYYVMVVNPPAQSPM